jgi:hypothetical protein
MYAVLKLFICDENELNRAVHLVRRLKEATTANLHPIRLPAQNSARPFGSSSSLDCPYNIYRLNLISIHTGKVTFIKISNALKAKLIYIRACQIKMQDNRYCHVVALNIFMFFNRWREVQ